MNIHYSNQNKIFNLHTDEIPYLSIRMLDELGVPNLYTSRYESFDTESGTGAKGLRVVIMKTEDPEEAAPLVLSNRDKLARQLGASIEQECITDQKHTNHVYVVTPEDLGPDWPAEKPLRRQCVDGLITDIPGAVLTAFGGDCPPVYIADPVNKAVGLVHAGWKGTLGRIPAEAIKLMTSQFGSDPADLYAAIGPGVCLDCYEMGDEVYDLFVREWSKDEADRIFRRYPAKDIDPSDSESRSGCNNAGPVEKKAQNSAEAESSGTMTTPATGKGSGTETTPATGKGSGTETASATGKGSGTETASATGKYHLDLREANRITLLQAGVRSDRIAVSNVCTMCNAGTFYSYRAHCMENEQAAMIVNRFD